MEVLLVSGDSQTPLILHSLMLLEILGYQEGGLLYSEIKQASISNQFMVITVQLFTLIRAMIQLLRLYLEMMIIHNLDHFM